MTYVSERYGTENMYNDKNDDINVEEHKESKNWDFREMEDLSLIHI